MNLATQEGVRATTTAEFARSNAIRSAVLPRVQPNHEKPMIKVPTAPRTTLQSAGLMGILGGDRIATIRGQEIVVRGDIVLSMAGIAIKSEADGPKIREKVGTMSTGQPFKASVLRAGKVIELTGKAP